MNLDQLGAQFEGSKGPVLAVAAVGVGGLALYARHKKAAAAAPGQGVSTAPAVSAGGQTAGMSGAGGAYDSSSSDVYGLLQPQLESLGGQLTDLKNQMNNVPVSAAPTPAPTPVSSPAPASAPPQAAPRPPSVPVPAARPSIDTWVTVNRGDTLSGIAARYKPQDITWQSIAQQNGIRNPNVIHAGQRVHVVG